MNSTIVVVVIIVVVGIVLIASVVSEIARRRSVRHETQEHYQHGPLNLRTLPPETQQRYRDEWNGIQQRFADSPEQAVRDADRLVQVIMRDIGYPVDDIEQSASDVFAEHPDIARHYSSAHAVATAQRHGEVAPEPLRQAAGDYRVLVDDLLAQARE